MTAEETDKYWSVETDQTAKKRGYVKRLIKKIKKRKKEKLM